MNHLFGSKQLRFQHSKLIINEERYNTIREHKRVLLKNITNVLHKLDIKYVIAHGNLLEYVRGSPIVQDDDLDIRFDVRDIKKWVKYVSSLKNNKDPNNKLFIKKRLSNYYVIRLNSLEKCSFLTVFSGFCDFVSNDLNDETFNLYDVFDKPLRKINYMDIETYVPDKDSTHKVLKDEYGENYIIPIYDYTKYDNLKWLNK
jgi:hypothetical protein